MVVPKVKVVRANDTDLNLFLSRSKGKNVTDISRAIKVNSSVEGVNISKIQKTLKPKFSSYESVGPHCIIIE